MERSRSRCWSPAERRAGWLTACRSAGTRRSGAVWPGPRHSSPEALQRGEASMCSRSARWCVSNRTRHAPMGFCLAKHLLCDRVAFQELRVREGFERLWRRPSESGCVLRKGRVRGSCWILRHLEDAILLPPTQEHEAASTITGSSSARVTSQPFRLESKFQTSSTKGKFSSPVNKDMARTEATVGSSR